MGVDMLSVHMDGDHRFVAIQVLPRKLRGDLQRQFRRDFSRLEGLNHMVILHTVHLAMNACRLLRLQHLTDLSARVAVQVDGEDLFLGFFLVENVIDASVQGTFPGQDFCDGHSLPPHRPRGGLPRVRPLESVFQITPAPRKCAAGYVRR